MLSDEKHWREATAQDTLGGYKIYLNLHADGSYAAEAQNKIAVLTTKPLPPPVQQTPPPVQTFARMAESQGFDVFGHDIGSVKGLDFSGCSAACAANPQCAAAAYRPDLRRCYLKSTATLVVLNGKVDIAMKADIRDRVRFSDFEMLPQSLEMCENTSGCNAFSYVTSNRACWLKSGVSNLVGNPPVVSGRRVR
jgi:PAN domain